MIRKFKLLMQTETLRRKLLLGGLTTAAIRVGGILLMLASSVVLARTLGVEGFGTYALALSIMTIIAIPVHLGLPTLVLRETAISDASGDLGRMKGIWFWAVRIVVVASILVLALAGAAWLLLPGLISAPLAVAFLLIPLIALGRLLAATLKGLRKIGFGQLPENILRPGMLVLLVLGVGAVWPATLQPEQAMGLHVVASAVAFGVGGWLLLKSQPWGVRGVPADLSQSRAWRAALIPMALVGGLQVINQNVGVVVLGAVATEVDVALFRVALSASSLILLGLQIVTPPFEPYFVRYYQSGDAAGLQHIAITSTLAGFATTLPLIAVFLLGGEWLLTLLYGAEFAPAYPVLAVLSVGQLLRVYFGPCESIMMLIGQERQGLFVWILAALAGAIMAVPLSLIFGATGAAVAASSTLVILRASQWWLLRHKLGIDTALHASLTLWRG